MQVAMDPVTAQLTPVTAPLVAGYLNESTFVTAELTPLRLSPSLGLNEAQRPELIVKRKRLIDSEGVELLRIDGPAYYSHPMNLILPAVFGAAVNVSFDGSRVVIAFSGKNEVRWYSAEGRLLRISRQTWSPEPVTQAMIDEYLRRSVPPLRESLARDRTFAETLPGFSAFLLDHDGNVWLRRYESLHGATLSQYVPTYDGPSKWTVLDNDGLWLSDIELPAQFTPLDITAEAIVGIARDATDVESIRRYSLRKRG
jgi:hypothetical protein